MQDFHVEIQGTCASCMYLVSDFKADSREAALEQAKTMCPAISSDTAWNNALNGWEGELRQQSTNGEFTVVVEPK